MDKSTIFQMKQDPIGIAPRHWMIVKSLQRPDGRYDEYVEEGKLTEEEAKEKLKKLKGDAL